MHQSKRRVRGLRETAAPDDNYFRYKKLSGVIDRLFWAIKHGSRIPPFPENLDIPDAYEVQKKVSERIYSSKLVGLKAGVTSEEMQNALRNKQSFDWRSFSRKPTRR